MLTDSHNSTQKLEYNVEKYVVAFVLSVGVEVIYEKWRIYEESLNAFNSEIMSLQLL